MIIRPAHPAFTTPVSQLKGVGPKTLARLEAEGILTTGDLLGLCPRFYQDRRQPVAIASLIPGQDALVEATVLSAKISFSPRSRRRFLQAQVEDGDGGCLHLFWFNFPPYLPKSLAKGRRLRLFGRPRASGPRLEMIHPDLDFLPEADDGGPEDFAAPAEIRPVYPPLGELSSGQVKKLVVQALALLADCPPLMEAGWLAENQLEEPIEALKTLHAPPADCRGMLPRPSQTRAFRRLAFFELFFWRLMMLQTRAVAAENAAPRPSREQGRAAMLAYWETLPFRLSPEQQRVAAELAADLSGPRPMSRLLQGEVGGGKTAVAASALFFALGCGGQAAIMAPTEVLARQHYDFLKPSADRLGYATVLLTGTMPDKEKRAARAALAEGRAQLAVGSQALLSTATVFQKLSLAVIDEQHRFGVRQRLTLRRKSEGVDILAMSATPIPRSLALMLYGDLDSSILKGLLPGRRPAETLLFTAGDRSGAYRKFLELLRQTNGQGFVVTARIDGETAEDGQPQEEKAEAERLSLDEMYGELKKMTGGEVEIGRLHGRMDADSQKSAMEDFRQGRSRILVATSIIEVGVDVPAAGVMLIEGAEYFGLSQLHQLRGRVGRGGREGFCLLLPAKATEAGNRRLAALSRESDGQTLAELDLEMRGPGEQLGLRQSGWPGMNYARLPHDLPLLAKAHSLAEQFWADKSRWADIQPRLDFKGFEDRPAGELD
ncbi:MAG: ATP-dependent DNA helicase RecG [Candidatus Adiutrix sp.]|jgi:ATP-dependent DNA helicase RecG|nr:ATP-dependent DNA helicase RecG [Candidatus Adiutrix sp.]